MMRAQAWGLKRSLEVVPSATALVFGFIYGNSYYLWHDNCVVILHNNIGKQSALNDKSHFNQLSVDKPMMPLKSVQ